MGVFLISIDSLAVILMLPVLAFPKVVLIIVPPSRIFRRWVFKSIFPEVDDSVVPAVPICIAEALMSISFADILMSPPIPAVKTGLKITAP